MDRRSKGLVTLLVALVVGAAAQTVARREAIFLGMTGLELFLLGAGVAAVVKRVGVD